MYAQICVFSFIYLFMRWSGTESIIRRLYHRWMIDGNNCGAVSGMNEWQGKRKYWEETCPSAALSTTDPTHDMTCAQTRPAAVGSLQLTT
jgi:hypothetical protein